MILKRTDDFMTQIVNADSLQKCSLLEFSPQARELPHDQEKCQAAGDWGSDWCSLQDRVIPCALPMCATYDDATPNYTKQQQD